MAWICCLCLPHTSSLRPGPGAPRSWQQWSRGPLPVPEAQLSTCLSVRFTFWDRRWRVENDLGQGRYPTCHVSSKLFRQIQTGGLATGLKIRTKLSSGSFPDSWALYSRASAHGSREGLVFMEHSRQEQQASLEAPTLRGRHSPYPK